MPEVLGLIADEADLEMLAAWVEYGVIGVIVMLVATGKLALGSARHNEEYLQLRRRQIELDRIQDDLDARLADARALLEAVADTRSVAVSRDSSAAEATLHLTDQHEIDVPLDLHGLDEHRDASRHPATRGEPRGYRWAKHLPHPLFRRWLDRYIERSL